MFSSLEEEAKAQRKAQTALQIAMNAGAITQIFELMDVMCQRARLTMEGVREIDDGMGAQVMTSALADLEVVSAAIGRVRDTVEERGRPQ